jgi:hypothetical protein
MCDDNQASCHATAPVHSRRDSLLGAQERAPQESWVRRPNEAIVQRAVVLSLRCSRGWISPVTKSQSRRIV